METNNKETDPVLFPAFLPSAFDNGDYATDDIIAFVIPLFRQVQAFHESGLVGSFEKENSLFLKDHYLRMGENAAHSPREALHKVLALFPRVQSKNFEVVGKLSLLTDAGEESSEIKNAQVHADPDKPLEYPAYLPGYQCFEFSLGHHDPQSDIFCLGLVLSSMALSLDLYDTGDLELFARVRSNPTLYNERIHPTIGRLITEMTELDRNKRTQDLYDAILRLHHYRDYDPEKQTDLSKVAGWMNKELKERDAFILNRLRNRLFDTSRRNRLLFFKPNMRFVNLTVSSVPIVLHYQSIRPEHLFTWNDELADKVCGMKEIVLNKYLRFEDHGYLPSSLDQVRVESQRSLQEFGLSQLKLVIAFLHWHNLKEDKKERIQSPLLLVPVSLKKNKKVKEDHYVLKAMDNAAEVNPVLAGQLKDLYGIKLPDFIDLDEISPKQFYLLVKEQIEEANQGIALHYIDKPRINLMHSEATLTVNNYRKRLRRQGGFTQNYQSIPYSYDQENYKPLGLEIFRQRIEPKNSFLEFLVNGDLKIFPENPDNLLDPDIREKEIYTLAQSENNPYNWEFDVCNMVVGNFNYKKMSLVRDYNLVIDNQLQHHVFDDLFSDQPKTFPHHIFDLNRTDDWFHVITADPSQTRAILQSRAGYSYIIQGPPGTGKSQTITNLIADFVARGKNVLFVCEKRAALDVVYHRLKQNGLDELCCYIHDSQGDKREFIKNLKNTYEDFTGNKWDLGAIRTKRTALLEKMNGHLDLLKEFHFTGSAERKETGMPVKQLIDRMIALREYLVNVDPKEEELLPSYMEWQESAPVIRALEESLEESGSDPIFSEHPFSKINDRIFLADQPYRLLGNLLEETQRLLQEIQTVFQSQSIAKEQTVLFDQVKNLIHFAVLLYPLALTGNLSLADPGKKETQDLEREMSVYRQQQEKFREAAQKNIYWKQKLSQQDTLNGLPFALKNERSFLGILNGNWKKLKRQIQENYDFSVHSVRPDYSSLLDELKMEYEASGLVKETRQRLQERFGLDNLDSAWLSLELLHARQSDKGLAYLLQHPEGASLAIALHSLHQPVLRLEAQLKQCLDNQAPGALFSLQDELQNIEMNLDSLRELLPVLRSFTGLPVNVRDTIRRLPLPSVQIEAFVARKTLHEFYLANRAFASIDKQALEKAVLELGSCYTDLQRMNAEFIRAFIRQRFLQQIDQANMAGSQLNEEQRKNKKIYTEGRKILENEFGKSMRYKSIRELSAKESGRILKDIKPVWLMSPYSVSDSLPLDRDYFDVVIFDEASQITLEEGVPSLYRSRQTIIVGDEKQMPPTDFFGARSGENDPDDLEKPEEEDPEEWLSHDADSLLAQGARKLTSTLLSWHYRSHYETLISFSNYAFYGGELLTIPDKTIHHRTKAAIEITCSEDAVRMADCLSDRSISFHLHTGTVYEKRSNEGEADYIAHLVRELLFRNTRESIGIVAFSQEQQHTIGRALNELGEKDPVFGQKLEEIYNRTEDDQFTGLIVKNLENIQGDERDIIIMSVCYGMDAGKKMLMNFGPVNKKGGEKRLNVLFSRAKKHMAVVSSIRHTQITNEYNEGANYLKKFLYYAERISLGDMKASRTILDGLALHREEDRYPGPASLLERQLKEQLMRLGYEVAEQVGQSGFKCSLAVKVRPEDEHYSVGILIDDDRHYQNKNLIEQYYQRPAILKSFGWRVVPVFAKDWLHQPQKVIEQIQKELRLALLQETATIYRGGSDGSGDISTGQKVLAEIEFPEKIHQEKTPFVSSAGIYDHLSFERLLFRDNVSDKFWEAATDDNKLIVRWGKAGSRGQIQIKTFPDLDHAKKEKERLIKEKRSKGYSA
ncbi:AAA domain-containing protein [Flavitalea flava]